ncbi:putative CCR4-associated factor 1-like protein 7 [Platysternon megacephalum]|uniref:Putative CCR4-associated factor 1-like protein 7 n=1 Tax=Platysternon megacephalum TaxID=55544 RepID=A0A4D9DCU1_9SAUR|nr:putative CCR4-associated factor 1-like protein 7 [Platysternon megacephalum]
MYLYQGIPLHYMVPFPFCKQDYHCISESKEVKKRSYISQGVYKPKLNLTQAVFFSSSLDAWKPCSPLLAMFLLSFQFSGPRKKEPRKRIMTTRKMSHRSRTPENKENTLFQVQALRGRDFSTIFQISGLSLFHLTHDRFSF